ncbi:MAG: glycosyltransferase family 4 protein [Balneolaceae bacterium]
MQSVSLQLMKAMEEMEEVELETLIQRTPWKNIGYSTTGFLFRLLYLIPSAVERFRPDVILFSSMVTAIVAPFLSRKVDTPMIAINHGQDVTLPLWIYQKYLPVVFRHLSGVISVSEATRRESIKRGMAPEKGIALPNGLDPARSVNLPAADVSRRVLAEQFGIDSDPARPLILTVGRQVKRKGHAWFIREVMPLLAEEVEYLIVGDGPEYGVIQQQIEDSGFGSRVFLTGRQPDEILQMAYSAANLFVMPNIPVEGDMEGFGIVLLEANQAGVPAVASDLEGIRDVITQGVNGYRVPYGDAEAFAEKVKYVLSHERESLSVSAKEHVLEQFSWNRVVREYVAFLRRVAENSQ